MTKTCVQLVSGFECGAIVQEGTEGYENSRCPEHFAYHMNKREVVLTLDETDGIYRCTSNNCGHDFSPYFGRDFAEARDIRYTVARLENLGFRVKLVENHDMDTLNPHMVANQDRYEIETVTLESSALRSMLALPAWSSCQSSHWYRVRYAENGIDRGYVSHVRAHSPNDARRMVLRDGEWTGHDNREILSIECFEYPEPEFETNSYRGLDVGAYGDY